MAQIKKDTSLRKAILQAAITGQLISDIGGESLPLARTSLLTTPSPRGSAPKTPTETGKQLLERIIEERNKKLLAEWEEALKKNPKAKKPAPIVATEIDEDEIPFEIPENWCWCRLDDLFLHNTGKALNKAENKEGTELEYITTSNLYWNHFELDNLKTMLFKDSEIEKCTVHKGDLLVCEGGEVGRTAIWNFDRTVCIQNHIHKLRAYESSLNKKFYYYVMFLYKEGKVIEDYAKGIGIKGLSSNALGSIILPLPPLSVQNAIVAKLEQVLPLVDAYENAVLQKEELKSTLSDKVKKAILQEAITGKLTEEWRKSSAITESGEQLLDRIIKERNAKALADWEEKVKTNPKTKKPVPVVASEIEEEEIPFEIPESWCWCRIDDLFAHNSGKALNKSENKEGTELEYITTSNLYWNYFELDNLKTMLFKDEEIEKCTVRKGDLLVCEGGEVGRSAIWNFDRTVCIQNHIHRLRAYNSQLNILFYYYVMHLFKESKVIENYAKGIGIKGLSSNALGSIIVPLPPLEEQEEIVKKVEELLELCK